MRDIPGCMAPSNSSRGRPRVTWLRTRCEAGVKQESRDDLDKLAQGSVVVVH